MAARSIPMSALGSVGETWGDWSARAEKLYAIVRLPTFSCCCRVSRARRSPHCRGRTPVSIARRRLNCTGISIAGPFSTEVRDRTVHAVADGFSDQTTFIQDL